MYICLWKLVQLFGKESSCSALISALLQQLHTLSLPFFQSGQCLEIVLIIQVIYGLAHTIDIHCRYDYMYVFILLPFCQLWSTILTLYSLILGSCHRYFHTISLYTHTLLDVGMVVFTIYSFYRPWKHVQLFSWGLVEWQRTFLT